MKTLILFGTLLLGGLLGSPAFAATCDVVTPPTTFLPGVVLNGDLCGFSGGRLVELQYKAQAGVVADTLVKSGAGVLHTLTCASDAAATAGTLAVRDATSAGAGTILMQLEFTAAYFTPVTLTFDYAFSTGLYLDYTTTGDVMCSVSYR